MSAQFSVVLDTQVSLPGMSLVGSIVYSSSTPRVDFGPLYGNVLPADVHGVEPSPGSDILNVASFVNNGDGTGFVVFKVTSGDGSKDLQFSVVDQVYNTSTLSPVFVVDLLTAAPEIDAHPDPIGGTVNFTVRGEVPAAGVYYSYDPTLPLNQWTKWDGSSIKTGDQPVVYMYSVTGNGNYSDIQVVQVLESLSNTRGGKGIGWNASFGEGFNVVRF